MSAEVRLEPALEEVSQAVYRYARFRLRHAQDAEDATMETLHALRNRPDRFMGSDNRTCFALGVCRRKVADVARANRVRRIFSRSDPAPKDIAETQFTVHHALGRLSDSHREVLALKYFLELTQGEIAALLGKSPEAVNSLLQRARAALANQLPEDAL